MATSKKDHKIAFDYYLAKEYDKAFEYYKKHISQKPRPYGQIYHNFVETCSELNIDVSRVYEDAIVVATTQENFLELYTFLMTSGRFGYALHVLKRLFSLNDAVELNYISYGMEFFNNGHYDYAIEVYNEAISQTDDEESIEFFKRKIQEATQQIENDSKNSSGDISEYDCESISFLIEYNNLEAIKKQIEKNNNVIHCKDRMGRTLLMYAVTSDNFDIVQYLVDKGANIKEVDDKKWQPIHFAAEHEKFSMVKFLLENGADINAQNGNGSTVLHKFIYDEEVREYLLAKGADINLKNFHDVSAQDMLNY